MVMAGHNSGENSTFPYQPLHDTKRQIRLLVVNRSNKETGRQYSLQVRSLDKKPRYRALSYQLGTGAPDHAIEFDDRAFYIRKSVHDFLHTMPVDDLIGAWFLDAICVNQSDHHERAAQVRLMGILYSRAQSVIAWLGPDHAVSESGSWIRARIAFAWMTHPTADLGDLFRWLRMDDEDLEHILTARQAASRPYWTRLWVVQEVLFVKDLRIMIGQSTVPVKSVTAWAEGNHFHSWRSEYWSVRSRPASWLTAYGTFGRDSFGGSLTYPLYKALITFGTQGSLDPRDTVFSILGLATTNIAPDYDLTITEV
ncbi:hypothetical protein LTR78_005893 [Recurvomyces mirabilis]|uniref:Heterokaryon incompatibility domain-containing protein n=1 Tax=Recurvomyces mirabilis TaxID=574656 RepID=A0AAE0WLS7_9PEZI|nr:hypothetical protein LTR78_005893 [Recurvomyces mirabilis]KAK5155298.1 hypothetical protein LTS14_006253 [Recurvomyces mirabilis]